MKTNHDEARRGRQMSRPSDLEAQAAAGAVLAIAEHIRAVGTIPSGHLYARLMGHMSLETYETIIGILVEAGKIKRHRHHLLEWVGGSRKEGHEHR